LNRLALVLALGIMSGNTFAGKVSLAWNASAGATGYRLFYGTASRNYTALVNTKAARSYTLYGLTAGRRYYFAVRAYNASKVSAYSTEISTIVRLPVCTVVASALSPRRNGLSQLAAPAPRGMSRAPLAPPDGERQ
jgi:hypothetical protein